MYRFDVSCKDKCDDTSLWPAASSSACPPISPIMMIPSVAGSFVNLSKQSMKSVPLKGSPKKKTIMCYPGNRIKVSDKWAVVIIPPIPTQVVCPRPHSVVWATASYVRVPDLETIPIWPEGQRYRSQHLLSQCAADTVARWLHADRCNLTTFYVNISRHNANFALPWFNDSRTVWTDQSAFCLLTKNILDLKFEMVRLLSSENTI